MLNFSTDLDVFVQAFADVALFAGKPSPIDTNYDFVSMEGEGKRLRLSCCDGTSWAVASVDASIQSPGQCHVPASKLVAYLKGAGGGDLSVEMDSRHVRFETGSGFLVLPRLEEREGPPFDWDLSSAFSFDRASLGEALEAASIAADAKMWNDAYRCVEFFAADGSARLASTDGVRLSVAWVRYEAGQEGKTVSYLPVNFVRKIARILRKHKDTDHAHFLFSANGAVVRCDGMEFGTASSASSYPDIERVLQAPPRMVQDLGAGSLREAVERAGRFAGSEGRPVTLELDGNMMLVTSETHDECTVTEYVSCRYDGPQMKIKLKSGFLIDWLKLFDGEGITMLIENSESAVHFCLARDPGLYRYVVMPMRDR